MYVSLFGRKEDSNYTVLGGGRPLTLGTREIHGEGTWQK